MKGLTNYNSYSKNLKKERRYLQSQLKSFEISSQVCKSGNLNQRQTPPLLQFKGLQKPDTLNWMKCYNFAKRLEQSEKPFKHRRKQKSADIVYLNQKPLIFRKPQDCVSSLSQFGKKKKKKEFLQLKVKTMRDKEKKHRKKKLGQIPFKKNNLLKRKNKPIAYEFFRPSKLVSLKSVDCSLVDSTKQQQIEFNFTENLYYRFQPQQYPFYSQQIKKYQQLYSKNDERNQVLSVQEDQPVSHTEYLIKKYIGKNHYESIDFENNSQKSLSEQSLSKKMIIDISPINEKKQKQKQNQMKKVLLNKVQQMLHKIEDQKQLISRSSQKDSCESNQSKNQLKTINILTFTQLFSLRKRTLDQQRAQDLIKLQDKFEIGDLRQKQFIQQRKKINRWTNYQIQNTEKIKNLLKTGVKDALKILSNKVQNQIGWSQIQRSKKLRRNYCCKSSSILKSSIYKKQNKKTDNKNLLQTQKTVQKTSQNFFKLNKIQEAEKNQKQLQIFQELRKKQLYENVYQCTFIDICLQLFEDQHLHPQKIKKYFCGDSNKNKRKGFDSSKKYVVNFIRQFISYVRNDQQMNSRMNRTLQKPIGPSPTQMLKYMRQNEEFDEIQEIQKNNQESSYVFNFTWFEKFSKLFIEFCQFQDYYRDKEKQEKRIVFLQHAIHFHNKAIFDALNEHIDKYRPYGLFGIPFPWKSKPLLFHRYSQQYIIELLGKAAMQVNNCCLFLCGLILDRQDSKFNYYTLSQRQICELKEDRMSRLLTHDLTQNQPRWIFFDDQETQILVNVSNFILQYVLNEISQQIIYQIQKY